MAYSLHVRLLGQPQIERDGQPIAGFRSQKALALLSYLATQNQPIPREQLIRLFWSKLPLVQGRSNLRWTLNHLASFLPGCLIANRQTIQFESGAHCWLDLMIFEARIKQGSLSMLVEAATLYRSEFMAGMTLEDCVEFDLWLALQRTHWQQRVLTVLEALVARSLEQRDDQVARQFAARWLELDPLSETAHRQMMHAYVLAGQREPALVQYETCRHILQSELGLEPDAATTALYRHIRGGM